MDWHIAKKYKQFNYLLVLRELSPQLFTYCRLQVEYATVLFPYFWHLSCHPNDFFVHSQSY